MTLSQSSDFSCNTPPLNDTLPALFTRMPMPPSSLSTLLSAGSNPARLLTSNYPVPYSRGPLLAKHGKTLAAELMYTLSQRFEIQAVFTEIFSQRLIFEQALQ